MLVVCRERTRGEEIPPAARPKQCCGRRRAEWAVGVENSNRELSAFVLGGYGKIRALDVGHEIGRVCGSAPGRRLSNHADSCPNLRVKGLHLSPKHLYETVLQLHRSPLIERGAPGCRYQASQVVASQGNFGTETTAITAMLHCSTNASLILRPQHLPTAPRISFCSHELFRSRCKRLYCSRNHLVGDGSGLSGPRGRCGGAH
jgi:hypothetical protein